MHGGIGFDLEQFGHMDRAWQGHAADIVAQQIDDHQILSPVLFVAGQEVSATGILGHIFAAGLGPLHRSGLDAPGFICAKEQFGRAAEQVGQSLLLNQRAVANGLTAGQGRVKRRAVPFDRQIDWEGQIGLINVPGPDGVMHGLKRPTVSRLIPTRLELGNAARRFGQITLIRRVVDAEAQQRQCPIFWQTGQQARLQRITKLVTGIPR